MRDRISPSRRTARLVAAVLLVFFITRTAAGFARIETTPPRAVSAILIEASTGQILFEMNADEPRAPASIAKLMLELVVLERVERGELRLDEPITVSAWASKMGGSQVYLAEGEIFPLVELMRAIVIASANDACTAVAERTAGTDEGFVDLMNIRARELGLTKTHYVNVHGLDDMPGRGNVTTARDIATIARHLVAFPHVLEWSGTKEAPFRNGDFILHNTNKLLGGFPGLDGLKTGFTNRAGYCLCATAERDGMRLISVILGADSNRERFRETAHLLGAGFAQMRKKSVIAEGETIPGGVPVLAGRKALVETVAGDAIDLVLPTMTAPPKPVLVPLRGLRAPVARGDTVGTVEVRLEDGEVCSAPALAAADVKRETVFQWIGRLFGGNRQ